MEVFAVRNRRNLFKRLCYFLVGLALCGFGIALCTCPGLGTTPISSLPYVLTKIFSLSFGIWTVVINTFFILGQAVMLRRFLIIEHTVQFVAVLGLGFFIDLGMYLFTPYIPSNYFLRIVFLLSGCLILSIGILLEVAADIAYTPGDGFVKTFAAQYKKNFGFSKICFDWVQVILALILSVSVLGFVYGIREGTVIAAFIVGYILKLIYPFLRFLRR